ncbi:MAG: MFS transporter [Actinomycetota bacterium]
MRLAGGRDFRLILGAGIVSQLGDWSARLALALLVLERGGGPAVVGVVGMLFTIPWLGPGQLLTAWSARFPRRTVMVVADSVRAVVFLAIGISELSTAPMLVLVGIAAMADPAFEATKSALITDVVTKDEYAGAIQMVHVTNQSSSLIGYAIGGVLVGLVGAETTLTLNGLSFALSTLLILMIRNKGFHEDEEREQPSLRNGLRFLRGDPISALAFGVTVLAATMAMSVESQVAVYGQAVAGLEDELIGVLSAVTPAATLIAVAFMRMDGSDGELLTRVLLIGAVASGGACALLWWGADDALAFVAFALVGVVFLVVTTTNVVVGRRLPDSNRVSIFSILQSGVFLGLSVGALLGGVVSEATSPETAAGLALLVCTVGLVLALPFAFDRPKYTDFKPRTRWSKV